VPKTIKAIAEKAGVSIATVSHVINHTRYVSPELVSKVNAVIRETGYREKHQEKVRRPRTGTASEVALLVPSLSHAPVAKLIEALSACLTNHDYSLRVQETKAEPLVERRALVRLSKDKSIAGFLVVPSDPSPEGYAYLQDLDVRVLFIGRNATDRNSETVYFNVRKGVYHAVLHLLESGHEKIGILLDQRDESWTAQCVAGARLAVQERQGSQAELQLLSASIAGASGLEEIKKALERETLTALVATSPQLTLAALQALEQVGQSFPQDVSFIGFGDEPWFEVFSPPLTVLRQDVKAQADLAVEWLKDSTLHGNPSAEPIHELPVELVLRRSTRIIGKGPFGEGAVSPDEIEFSDQEITRLRISEFRVAISLHHGGTAWAALHEAGIRETLRKMGIRVVSLTDAHFDPRLQITQLESIQIQNPDAIIAIPTNDKATSRKFKELSRTTPIVFISNVPEGFTKEDYAVCVSVNEQENGYNAGTFLGECFREKPKAKVALLKHGIPFYGTHLRDSVAEHVLRDQYPNLDIVETRTFLTIENAYDECLVILRNHPDLDGLYVSWDRPALEAIRALEKMGRDQVSVVTCDLDLEIASYLASRRFVRGLSCQRPYEQGVAVAKATALALLKNTKYKYIGVSPSMVVPRNLAKSWREIIRERLPEELETLNRQNLRKFDTD
jgi:ribose transport system substrate-binding protein